MAVLLKNLLGLSPEERKKATEISDPKPACDVCRKPFTHADRMAEEIEEKPGGRKVHVGCGDPPD